MNSSGFVRQLRRIGQVLAAAVLVGGCSTMDMKPVYSAEGPSVIIASHDVSQVKAAILAQTSGEHFKLDVDAGEHLDVSRRLSALKVFLLTETIAGQFQGVISYRLPSAIAMGKW